jgi:hypothetical protein
MPQSNDELVRYLDQNAREVAALVEIGAMDTATAHRAVALLRDRYPTLRHLAVSDRVDLARDLAATLVSAGGLQ